MVVVKQGKMYNSRGCAAMLDYMELSVLRFIIMHNFST